MSLFNGFGFKKLARSIAATSVILGVSTSANAVPLPGGPDTTPPTITSGTFTKTGLSSSVGNGEKANTAVDFDIVMSESVTGFTVDDLTLTNATATLSGSNNRYTAILTPIAEGNVSASINANSFSDAAGNENTAGFGPLSYTYDITPPTATLGALTGPFNDRIFKASVTLSETPDRFRTSDFNCDDCTITGLTGGGTSYEVEITSEYDDATAGAGKTIGVFVGAMEFQDEALNRNAADSNTASYTYPAAGPVGPTATIASLAAFPVLPKGGGIASILITLSEPSTDFTLDDIEAVNASPTFLPLTPTVYSVSLFPKTDGAASIQVKANSFSNAAGTFNAASSNLESVTADFILPTATIDAFSGPVDGKYTANITLSETATDFTESDLMVGNGTATLSGNGTAYTATVTPTAAGQVSLQVKVNSFSDAATNKNEVASNEVTVTPAAQVDNTPPFVGMAQKTKTGLNTYEIIYTFSEDVTGVTQDDFTITNGTAAGLTGSGRVYTLSVTGSRDGFISIETVAGGISDAAGNVNAGGHNLRFFHDGTPPTASISPFTGPVDGKFKATITLSEATFDFAIGDLDIVNGTLTLVATQGDGFFGFTEYEAIVTPSGPGNVSLQVRAESFSDRQQNKNVAASNVVEIVSDTTPPTVSIAPFADPTGGTITATVTLSEASTDFTADDFNVTGGTLALTGSGTDYQATVTPTGQGVFVNINVNSNTFSDAAGNQNNRPSNVVSTYFDTVAPTVSIAEFEGPDAEGNYTAVITLSEPAFEFFGEGSQRPTFTAEDLQVFNGTSTLEGDVNGTRYVATVTPGDGDAISLTVGAGSISDPGGNVNNRSNRVIALLDTTPPTVGIAPFTGPTDGKYTAAITLSEVSTDFTSADLDVTNGTVTLTGSGTTYTATLTPSADGDVSLQVKIGSFSDAAGNNNVEASNTVTANFDSTPPTVSIAAMVGPTDGKYTAVITLSEESEVFVGEGQQVTSFTVDDLIVTNGTATLAGSGKSFTATITPTTDGDVTLQVKKESFSDAAGNLNADASNTVKVTYDGTPPTASVAALEGPTDGKYTAVITLSEVSTNFTVDDLTLTNATATLTGSGTSYTVTLTPNEDGEVAVLVKVSSFSDAAGNLNDEASNRVSADYDGTPPTVTLSGQPAEISDTSNFTINVAFSEDITGFTASDITVENGSVTALTGASPDFVATITPTGGDDVSISIGAGVVEDLAQNLNTASNTIVVKNMIAEITQKLIANATYARAINLINHQPNLTRFMVNSVETGDLDANVTQGEGIVSFKNNSDSPVWVEGHGSWTKQDDQKTKYMFGAFGKHMNLSENTILGAMAQVDYAKSKDGVQDHESIGWLIGPYIVAKVPDQPLYFEASALTGKTDNDVNPLGTYTDNYSSNRWILNGKVTGVIKQKKFTLEPNINFNYVGDKTEDYTDSLGNNILGSNIKVAQGSFDLDARIPMKVDNGKMELLVGGAAVYSDASGSGGAANVVPAYEGSRARFDAGIDRKWEKSSLKVTGFVDGVGAKNYESYGVNVRVTTVF